MILLELDGELAAAEVDLGPAGRPPLVQSGVDADNFPDRSLARIGAGTRSEPHPQRVAEVQLQGGVVGLRRGNLCLEQHPSVDRQPAPIVSLHLVRHRYMGVQIRVAGTAVAVGERAAIRPRTLTCRIPWGPVRVNKACCSMNAKASLTAA